MDDASRPAAASAPRASRDDARDLRLGHAGIMLDLERGEPAALVAAEADEAHDRADVRAPARQRSASAPASKSSRWTRTSPSRSAAGHRRKERDLARARDAARRA